MKQFRIIFLLVCFIVGLGVSAPMHGVAAEKVIDLSFSGILTPEMAEVVGMVGWGKEIEKRTKGRVKVTYFHNGTLTQAPKCYEGAVKGLSDVCHSVFSYTQGRFPLMEVTDLPGYTRFNAKLSSRVAHEVYVKFKPREMDDVHVFYLHCHTPGIWESSKKQIKTLEDMKGMRIRANGITVAMTKALGATPVGLPWADAYDALSRGVIDGTVGAATSLKGWRMAEVCKYSTWVPKAGYANAHFVVMNKKKWESLPPDIQNIITGVSNEWVEKTGEGWNAMDREAIKFAKTQGHQAYFPNEKEVARWETALKPLEDAYLKSMEAKGLPGKEALAYRKQLIEKYAPLYPSTEF